MTALTQPSGDAESDVLNARCEGSLDFATASATEFRAAAGLSGTRSRYWGRTFRAGGGGRPIEKLAELPDRNCRTENFLQRASRAVGSVSTSSVTRVRRICAQARMNRPYFQFPLCALRLPDSQGERLNCIISYCCIEVGKHGWAKLNEQQQEAWRSEPPVPHWREAEVSPMHLSHLYALLGASRLNVTIGHAPSTAARHMRLSRFLAEVEQKHGRDVQVRLATDLVFEARDDRGLSFPELAVLTAIYSKVGASKGAVRITREEIWRRAQGFKSKLAFSRETAAQQPYLTRRKVRSLIESLHERGFFARVTYARRQTYYSHRLTADELADSVFQQKTRAARARHTRIAANDALTKRILDERRNLAGSCRQTATSAATDAATEPPLK